ncbi:MAG TPA: EamA family transporter [Phycisphaerales bacterium]|nr:EamA family transporter [Phycisphaerales bacterium]
MNAIVLAVLAGLCWGVGEVFTKVVLRTKDVGPITAIAVRTTIELPILWLAYLYVTRSAKSEPTTWLHAPPATLTKLVIGSGIIAGAAGMLCFYSALSLGEISRVKPIAFSIAPATGVILGAFVLGEQLTLTKIIAVTLILIGVVLLTMK